MPPATTYHVILYRFEVWLFEDVLTKLVRDGRPEPQVHVCARVHEVGSVTVDVSR